MAKLPQIAEVQCSRLKFEPGDKILVRVFSNLDRDQVAKLVAGVKRWSGLAEEDILVYNALGMDITVEKPKRLLVSGDKTI